MGRLPVSYPHECPKSHKFCHKFYLDSQQSEGVLTSASKRTARLLRCPYGGYLGCLPWQVPSGEALPSLDGAKTARALAEGRGRMFVEGIARLRKIETCTCGGESSVCGKRVPNRLPPVGR